MGYSKSKLEASASESFMAEGLLFIVSASTLRSVGHLWAFARSGLLALLLLCLLIANTFALYLTRNGIFAVTGAVFSALVIIFGGNAIRNYHTGLDIFEKIVGSELKEAQEYIMTHCDILTRADGTNIVS